MTYLWFFLTCIVADLWFGMFCAWFLVSYKESWYLLQSCMSYFLIINLTHQNQSKISLALYTLESHLVFWILLKVWGSPSQVIFCWGWTYWCPTLFSCDPFDIFSNPSKCIEMAPLGTFAVKFMFLRLSVQHWVMRQDWLNHPSYFIPSKK